MTIVIYLAAMALVVTGFVYAFWRIRLLDNYLVGNREYVLARDARWEQHIKGQAALTKLILERLPEAK